MNTFTKKFAGFVGAFALAFVFAPSASANLDNSIADNAVATPALSTLVSLVSAVDLVETLDSEGSYTVFAPTNDAFAELSPEVLAVLEERPDILTDIILYHVVGEELFATEVLAAKKIETLQGEDLRPSLDGETPYINHSEIIAPDAVDASNGVVHLIDQVLMPKESAREIYIHVLKNVRDQLQEIRQELNALR